MFNRFIYLFTVLTVTLQAKPITISGKVINGDNAKVYIFAYDGIDLNLFDSTRIKSNSFTFKGKEFPRGLYKIGISPNESSDIVLGNENLQISFDKNSFGSSFKVSSSPENDAYTKFNKANIDFSQALQGLETKAQGIYYLKNSDPAKFDAEIKKLQKSADSLTDILHGTYLQIAKNPTLYTGKYALALMLKDTTQKKNVFKASEFADPELARSNLFAIKTQMYFQRYTRPEVPDYETSAQELIQNLPSKTKGKEHVYKTMLSLFANANLDYYGSILKSFKEEYIDQKSTQEYIKKLPKRDIGIGDEVPDISLKDTSNNTLTLSSLRGKVVLIDFWASWCGPCRVENPNVVKVFNKYKDKGFTVFGVSLDQNKDKWLGAIKNDKLTWSHVSDLKGWSSEGARLYGVKSIPQTFLIDKDGKVIAKNLRGEMLEQKLKEIFKE